MIGLEDRERDIRLYIPELGSGNGRACDQGRVVQGKIPSARSDVSVSRSCCNESVPHNSMW